MGRSDRTQEPDDGVSTAAESFFEHPILNSPYEPPRLHRPLDKDGQPLDLPPIEGRRRSELIPPVPKPRKRKTRAEQRSFVFGDDEGLSSVEQEYNPTPIITEIRSHISSWRELPNPVDWGVTPATARLLTHWRHHNFEGTSKNCSHWRSLTAPE
jgi:type III restriction enzyme